jgi:hypothetical protein
MKSERFFVLAGTATILVAGLLHLYYATQQLGIFPFIGILFILYFLTSIISALGIYRESLISGWAQMGLSYLDVSFFWGWVLGLLASTVAVIGFILSQFVGWPEAGILARGALAEYILLIPELLFIALFFLWRPVTLATGRKNSVSHRESL